MSRLTSIFGRTVNPYEHIRFALRRMYLANTHMNITHRILFKGFS